MGPITTLAVGKRLKKMRIRGYKHILGRARVTMELKRKERGVYCGRVKNLSPSCLLIFVACHIT
jgi:hypothetical protein